MIQKEDASGTVDYVGDYYEKNLTTGVETLRYRFGGQVIGTRVGGSLSYLYPDDLHSVEGANNGATMLYTPFGLVQNSAGSLPTDHQFQGQQNQSSVGLYHMGARWYDPTIGLWTQPDTLVPNPMDPLALNRYSFVEGNPLKYTDPSGHCPMCIVAVLTAPEWAPEVVAGAVLVAGALTVAIGQHQQEISYTANAVVEQMQLVGTQAFDDAGTMYSSDTRTLDRALGGELGDKKDAHHLIPRELKNHPVVKRARTLGWKFNGAGNGELLPDNIEDAQKEGKPAHTQDHSHWSDAVEQQLDEILRRATGEKWADDDRRWTEAVEELDKKLRSDLNDPNQNPSGQPLQ